jgi:hypothetical protein
MYLVLPGRCDRTILIRQQLGVSSDLPVSLNVCGRIIVDREDRVGRKGKARCMPSLHRSVITLEEHLMQEHSLVRPCTFRIVCCKFIVTLMNGGVSRGLGLVVGHM